MVALVDTALVMPSIQAELANAPRAAAAAGNSFLAVAIDSMALHIVVDNRKSEPTFVTLFVQLLFLPPQPI
jgi:hypothetical protein